MHGLSDLTTGMNSYNVCMIIASECCEWLHTAIFIFTRYQEVITHRVNIILLLKSLSHPAMDYAMHLRFQMKLTLSKNTFNYFITKLGNSSIKTNVMFEYPTYNGNASCPGSKCIPTPSDQSFFFIILERQFGISCFQSQSSFET